MEAGTTPLGHETTAIAYASAYFMTAKTVGYDPFRLYFDVPVWGGWRELQEPITGRSCLAGLLVCWFSSHFLDVSVGFRMALDDCWCLFCQLFCFRSWSELVVRVCPSRLRILEQRELDAADLELSRCWAAAGARSIVCYIIYILSTIVYSIHDYT